jgi:hypothetical protein
VWHSGDWLSAKEANMSIRTTALPLALLVTVVLLPKTAAKEDLLDIKALGLVPVGPVYSNTPVWGQPVLQRPLTWAADGSLLMVKGELVALRCKWSMYIVNYGDYWELPTSFYHNDWPGRLNSDGVPFNSFKVQIPYGTALGTQTVQTGLSSPCFPDFWNSCGSSVTYHYPHSVDGNYTTPPLYPFKATKLGKHTLRCVLDKPKSWSDRNPNNNTAWLRLTVTQPALSPYGPAGNYSSNK